MELQAVCWGGSFAVELVAAFAWNGWQTSSGISGNLGLEYAVYVVDQAKALGSQFDFVEIRRSLQLMLWDPWILQAAFQNVQKLCLDSRVKLVPLLERFFLEFQLVAH